MDKLENTKNKKEARPDDTQSAGFHAAISHFSRRYGCGSGSACCMQLDPAHKYNNIDNH